MAILYETLDTSTGKRGYRGVPAPTYRQETPSGSVNGTNVTFTLSNAPLSGTSVQVFLNGLICPQDNTSIGYSISGTSITFQTAPQPGQRVYAYYPS
jgi:hypothetical protein